MLGAVKDVSGGEGELVETLGETTEGSGDAICAAGVIAFNVVPDMVKNNRGCFTGDSFARPTAHSNDNSVPSNACQIDHTIA